jgi:diacylglycerol kinase (ATP)
VPSSPALPYDVALLVYNPHSTGGAEDRARSLQKALADLAPQLEVRLVPTEYAGHAREIAADAARTTNAVVVSVSGDGGYNEVVCGVMDGGQDGRPGAVAAVLPAGNANDHRRATRRRPLAEAIAEGGVEHLDLLRVAVDDEPARWAHSYVGLGITPVVALDLEKGGKGSFREILTTIRGFARFRPFEVVLDDGGRTSFDSLILANTSEMAKYATLSESGDPADGRFEVVTIPAVGRFKLLMIAIRAAVRGLGEQPTEKRFGFTTTSPSPVQLDGEVLELEADRHVVVEIAPRALATVR